MEATKIPPQLRGNPATFAEAQALLNEVAALCNPWNVDAMADGFTEDCVARFGMLPEMRGREAVRQFFRQRSHRQKNYDCRKVLRSMTADTLAIDWTGTWEDTATGKRMHGHGCEIWTLQGGKLARWDAAFNIEEIGAAANAGIV